jgi:hypothetical protein
MAARDAYLTLVEDVLLDAFAGDDYLHSNRSG